LAWPLCGLGLALLVATLLVLLVGRPPARPGGEAWQRQAADLLGRAGAPLLGGLIAARRPDNPYGWLWLAFGLSLAVAAFADAYAAVALMSSPAGLPGLAPVLWLGGLGFTAALSMFPFLFLLFPTGRLPSPRWRPWAWAIVAVGALMLIAAAFGSQTLAQEVVNPLAVGGWLGGVLDRSINLGFVGLFVATALSAVTLLLRLRRARGVERQQLKWFAYAAALLGAFILGDTLGLQTSGVVDVLVETLTLAGVYAGIGIAVLRYRLYEIDRLVNRTLVYGTVTALLGLVYAGAVLVLSQLFGGVGRDPPSWVVAGATLTVAALFQPARHRIQEAVDRRFNRRRYDMAKTIERFSARLRDEVDLDTLSAELLGVVDQTVQPTTASLWLRPSAEPAARRR
jgi:hypothetical protein